MDSPQIRNCKRSKRDGFAQRWLVCCLRWVGIDRAVFEKICTGEQGLARARFVIAQFASRQMNAQIAQPNVGKLGAQTGEFMCQLEPK
jgi:hypothetical protein